MKGKKLKLKGEVQLIIRDRNGKIREIDKFSNVITNVGREYVAKKLYGDSSASDDFTWIQIGTGTAGATVSDTALDVYYSEGQAATAYEADYKMRLSKLFSFTETVSITESGVFNRDHSSSPTMLARQTFSAKNMADGETLEVVWTVAVG